MDVTAYKARQDIVIAFCDPDKPYRFYDWFKKGFRHIVVYVPLGNGEWIEFDPDFFRELKHKQLEVIVADTLLPRIGNDSPSWFECKMCDARKVCFNQTPVKRNCRTCFYVDVLPEGKWSCANPNGRKNDNLVPLLQKKGCDCYKLGEIFLD